MSRRATAGVDLRIAAVATRHHGLVDRHQLRALGVTHDMRASRLARGLLHPVPGCPGVFAVGHAALGADACVAAAVLACGPGAAATGEHAEWLWDLRPPGRPPPRGRGSPPSPPPYRMGGGPIPAGAGEPRPRAS